MTSKIEQLAAECLQTVLDAAQDRQEGQGLVEYALIIALIAVALAAALFTLQGSISGAFSSIGASL
jgi:pilus assembly protein Flp/PilA